jgi:hypothetical protein
MRWLESRSFALSEEGAGKREASCGKALRVVERLAKLKKPVDDEANVLHNLVSLLLMQRRRTKRCRVVEARHGFGGECGPIFKN